MSNKRKESRLLLIGALMTIALFYVAWRFLDFFPEPAVKPPEPVKPAIFCTAEDLLALYLANEIAADQRYKGNHVIISGKADSIGRDILDTPYVTFKSAGFSSVQCMFPKAHAGDLVTLSPGINVQILGRVDGKFGNVLVRDCALLRIGSIRTWKLIELEQRAKK